MLLTNIGSPAEPTVDSVRSYLKEFLLDPRVIDLPAWQRQLLVRGIIAPMRAGRSAASYKKVWGPDGSPLVSHTRQFAARLRETLPENWHCEIAMRYGEPSMEQALRNLRRKQVKRLFLVPLFPQYAAATTGSAVAHLQGLLAGPWDPIDLPVETLPPFFDQFPFIAAWAANYRKHVGDFHAEHTVFSYHGLPTRQLLKSDPTGKHCQSRPDCCAVTPHPCLWQCYRAQCLRTTRLIADALSLPDPQWSVAFQSRLGRTPWIEPYLGDELDRLLAKGIKDVLILAPSFVADCLETLEEIGIGLAEGWQRAGGRQLKLIPSLNAEQHWVDAFAAILRRQWPIETPPA